MTESKDTPKEKHPIYEIAEKLNCTIEMLDVKQPYLQSRYRGYDGETVEVYDPNWKIGEIPDTESEALDALHEKLFEVVTRNASVILRSYHDSKLYQAAAIIKSLEERVELLDKLLTEAIEGSEEDTVNMVIEHNENLKSELQQARTRTWEAAREEQLFFVDHEKQTYSTEATGEKVEAELLMKWETLEEWEASLEDKGKQGEGE